MAFVLVARLTARDGEQDRAAELIGRLVEATRTEPGNVHYIPHRDPENPRVFILYEQYRDEAAFEEHAQSDHFKTLAAGELFGLMDERRREFYETFDQQS
jgi:quinol monooxygenase YgiN